MGTLVSTGQITIIDSNDGLSVFSAVIYTQTATQPTTPSGGSYNFSTTTLIPPTTGGINWVTTLPSATSVPIWVSQYTFYTNNISSTISGGTWSVPTLFTVLPNTKVTRYIFSSNASAPALPANNATTGWVLVSDSTTIWMSYQINEVDSSNNVVTYGSWQPAVKIKGETGDPGTPGTPGTKSITISAFKWSNTGAGVVSQAATYTWATNSINIFPTGWTASSSASPGTGYTLHMINLTITDNIGATTTSVNWSNALQNIIGYRQDGSIGPVGQSQIKAFSFMRATSVPTTPTGGTYASPVATGWSDGIPNGTNPIYVSTRIFTNDGAPPQQSVWTTPVLFAQNGTNGIGTSVRYIFSSSASAPVLPANSATTGWNTAPDSTTIWMSQQINTVDSSGAVTTYGSWQPAVKIKGETGNQGATGASGQGNVKSFAFIRATSAPATPTGGTYASPNPTTIGWSDGIPTGTNPIYVSTRIFTSDGLSPAQSVWTTPVLFAQNGTNGTPGANGIGGSARYIFSSSVSAPALPTPATTTGWNTSPDSTTIWMSQQINTIDSVGTITTYGIWQNAIKIKGETGTSGQGQLKSFAFIRTTSAPATPTGGTYSSPNPVTVGWSDGIPNGTNPIYVSTRLFTSDGLSPEQGVWTTPVLFTQNGTNGTPGTNGIGTSVRYIFSSSASAPVLPANNATTGWNTSPDSTTIWMSQQINNIDTVGTVTSYGTWSAAIKIKGETGNPGQQGNPGASHRIAYIVTYSATVPGPISSGIGDVPPTSPDGTWSFSAQSTLYAGQYMYQVDGTYTYGGNIVWGNPYLSNLKVGSLSAISANLGTVSISDTGSLSSTGKTFGSTNGGIYLGYSTNNYKFDVGNSTNYLRFDGTNLLVGGNVIATGNINSGAINAIESVKNSGTYQYVINSSTAGTEASLSIPYIALPLAQLDIITIRSIIFAFTIYTADTSPGRIEVRLRTASNSWAHTHNLMPDGKFGWNSFTVMGPITTQAYASETVLAEIRLWNMSSTNGQWNSANPPSIVEWYLTSIATKR